MFNSSFYQYTEDVGKELPNYSENLFSNFLKKNVLFPDLEDGVGELMIKFVLFILNYMILIEYYLLCYSHNFMSLNMKQFPDSDIKDFQK